ncbi:hypothetical protein QAD02_013245 [Eretmocerus hayati]|uniref:Uncharacterized protein n=1 Tax=Eretmocerus hayati TaxID=131215 RepID=A0ACC2P2Y5_9HYME|nr:hypothetical protein QAD02_013245 [Eretmocerus hayati]
MGSPEMSYAPTNTSNSKVMLIPQNPPDSKTTNTSTSLVSYDPKSTVSPDTGSLSEEMEKDTHVKETHATPDRMANCEKANDVNTAKRLIHDELGIGSEHKLLPRKWIRLHIVGERLIRTVNRSLQHVTYDLE